MTDQAKVATNLRAIEDMATRLEQRAIDRGADKNIPGGEAMIALAGVGSISSWTRRNELAEAAGDYDKPSFEDPDKFWPALQVLWYWTEGYRQRLSMDYDDPRWRPSLISEANFLRNRDVAEWIWDNETNWDNYAADVATARTKLENILVEGKRSERTRVVCDNPVCDNPKTLIRVYAKREPIEWECAGCGDANDKPDPCGACGCDEQVECRWESHADDDKWKCGGCRSFYTHKQVREILAKQMRSDGAERWVPVLDAIDLLKRQGWQGRTVRKWLEPLRHKDDKCTDCGTKWPAQEYAACPSKARGYECGGFLRPLWEGDRDAVPAGYCDITTHKAVVWWPDLWTTHLRERNIRERPKKASA